MSLANEAQAVTAGEHRSGLKGKKDIVLSDKNGNHVCERSRYALRKRKHGKLITDCEQDITEKKAKRKKDLKNFVIVKKQDEKCGQENSSPILKKNWRSRCGRKRKYFGHDSVRQGATRRERSRFNNIQKAFEELRNVIPKAQHPKDGKLSKYATLKLATTYISLLTNALESSEKMDEVWQSLTTCGLAEYGSNDQSDACYSSGSGLSDDELFKGDFTDILHAAEENEGSNVYELVMHGPDNVGNGITAPPPR